MFRTMAGLASGVGIAVPTLTQSVGKRSLFTDSSGEWLPARRELSNAASARCSYSALNA
jgi:hypothetical protein